MTPRRAGDRYHHGDLRAALTRSAIELIEEHGVRRFSLAEAARRVGVAVSAPYAHFADRDALLAAVAVHACELLRAKLIPAMAEEAAAPGRLAAAAREYVRFAAAHRRLFEVLFEGGLDKARHPELEAAERPITAAFEDAVRSVAGDDPTAVATLATAIEATAHGYAMLLLDGSLGRGPGRVEGAAQGAARAALALAEGRRLLTAGS